MIDALYPIALKCGIPAERFWDLTLGEINDTIEAFYDIQREKDKVQIERLFVLSDAISTRIGYIFNDKEKRADTDILQPWDVYPEAFGREREEVERRREEEEIEKQKAAFLARAAVWNEQFEETENGDET